MIYKIYKCNSFNVHTIKTDKFKTSHMEIVFRKSVVKEELGAYSFLLDIENEKSEINLKKEQYNLQVLVEYANLLKNKNDIQLSYFIETDDHENVLKIELIGEE